MRRTAMEEILIVRPSTAHNAYKVAADSFAELAARIAGAYTYIYSMLHCPTTRVRLSFSEATRSITCPQSSILSG